MSDFVCLDGRASDFVLLRLPEHVRGLDGLGGTSLHLWLVATVGVSLASAWARQICLVCQEGT